MKTNDFIDMLAAGVTSVERGVPARRLGSALAVAAVGAVLLMTIAFGVRPDLPAVMRTPIFWAKLAFPICVAAGAIMATVRLARPGATVGAGRLVVGVGIAAVWIAGLYAVATAAFGDRLAVVLGQTWRVCPFNIVLLSAPGFVAMFVAIRGLAPTRLRTAGAAAGLAASAIATIAYCFHCPEMSPAFWGVWYLLGMALPAALGALVAPIWLRW
ncbi:hypothetical protein BFR06_09340 [Burkholderia pseudomallei]|uniref:DUF1109 domain-containing protein n=1 Tax=Burkholderia pseudomallei TaxID=28450 RepID=UPI0004278CAA|nr:DUF1109 domain-containing protein [Burkholderia pseudomallei]AIP21713.1 hypothetical protein DP63_2371 [Burkholderia pseudomallei MSHR5855]AIP40946.1 hypothetical protein DP65_3472 [Burkholderia pseudomallei MSHR5848]APF92000.1 hypothetical protein BFR05_09335 [Burkholderia pseudomallei]APF98048.1 hypothetical protein BFR06_09340 [Burkholderia pseudomallei]KEO67070.1 hypothetical protein J103_24525 [Burkholderia pseudomallei MSHR5855]